ncbi:MAG: ChaN family lipoprotein [Thermodesulfobacteriota bacterium]
MKFQPLAIITLALLLLLLLSACAGKEPGQAEMPYPPSPEPQVGDILHIPTGYYVSQEQLLANVRPFPLVYVGELHDNPASHRLQLAVLKAMVKANPGQVALGMEMFTTGQQGVLDRWRAGELTEKEFLRATKWFTEGWQFDFQLYREILLFCRDQQVPLIALNVDKELARQVSMTPLAEMDDELKAQLPEMDLADPYQGAMVAAVMAGHSGSDKMLASFQRRQTLWDETMAQSVAHYLKENPGKQMLVMAGGWHVNYGFGIPRRVFRRLPRPYTIIASRTIKVAEGKEPQLMDITLPRFPMPEAHYLAFHEYELLESEEVRLGVLLGENDGGPGVRLAGVMPGSVAQEAGLAKDEILLAIDGEEVGEVFDVVYAVKQKRVNETASLLVQGLKGEQRTLTITFAANSKPHHGR